jgi:hypothetical protein
MRPESRSFVLSSARGKDTPYRDDVVGTFWPFQFWQGEILRAVPPIGRTDNREKSLILVNRNELTIAHRVANRREVTREQVDHPQNWFHRIFSFRVKTGLQTVLAICNDSVLGHCITSELGLGDRPGSPRIGKQSYDCGR